MNRVTVNDSEFHSIGYEAVKMLMEVSLRNGHIFLYSDVPMAVYDDFMRAEDKQEFYRTHIENQYPNTQVR
jgi:hypothetical protein